MSRRQPISNRTAPLVPSTPLGRPKPPVQSCPPDRERHERATQHQEQDGGIIAGRHIGRGGNAQQRQQWERQQRRRGERQRLGHPPAGHQKGERSDAPCVRPHAVWRRKQKQQANYRQSGPEAQSFPPPIPPSRETGRETVRRREYKNRSNSV